MAIRLSIQSFIEGQIFSIFALQKSDLLPFVTLINISPIPKSPMITGTNPTPSISVLTPKVNRGFRHIIHANYPHQHPRAAMERALIVEP